jgi:hypothetical protein
MSWVVLTTRSGAGEDHISTLELGGAVLPRSASAEFLVLALVGVAVERSPVVAGMDDLGSVASPLAVDGGDDIASNSACGSDGSALCHMS